MADDKDKRDDVNEEEEAPKGRDVDGEEGEEGEGGKAAGGRKKLIIIVAVAAVLIGGAAGGAFFFLSGNSNEEAEAEAAALAAAAQPQVHFLDLPEMNVNLDTGGGVARYLRLQVALEVASMEDATRIQTDYITPLQDDLQTYLRTLRVEDLQGSRGVYRLRETMLFRANQIVQPVQIRRVLFKEILVQ